MHTGSRSELRTVSATATANAVLRLKGYDLGSDDEEAIAYSYWDKLIREKAAEDKFDSAWRYLNVAARGEKVFEGPDRFCRSNVDGLPVGLVCSPESVMRLIHVLYYCMSHDVTVQGLKLYETFPSWEVQTKEGTSIELFACGNSVSQLMLRQHNLLCYVAAFQAIAIADWVNNRRRYGHVRQAD